MHFFYQLKSVFRSLPAVESKIQKFIHPMSRFMCSKNRGNSDSKLGVILKEIESIHSLKLLDEEEEEKGSPSDDRVEAYSSPPSHSEIEIFHPWPEWVGLMERLLQKGYFVGVAENGFLFNRGDMSLKDVNRIRTGCLNFARDRYDLIRYFSRKDIQVIVESGCPSLDRKVVNSGKRLRAYSGIDEGNVCCSCNLRGSCERAYVKAREDEGGRTVDVMRILLTYGLHPITGSVENELCLNKPVRESVRKLLNEVLKFSFEELSSGPPKLALRRLPFNSGKSNQHLLPKNQIDVPMKPGDWICPKCNFVNFARNIKCLRCNGVSEERLKNLKEKSDNLPMKKGDWICNKCNFLNFSKNTRCLQCKEKPLKRQLNPGEWECESCSYINFRRNTLCLKCDWKRPKASACNENFSQSQHESNSHHQESGLKFVRDDHEVKHRHFHVSGHQNHGEKDFQGNIESSSHDECFKFEDFPMLGGSSVVSQDPYEMEKWKDEMSKRSKRNVRVIRRDDYNADLSPATFPRSFNFGDSDDEGNSEIAGWFQCKSSTKRR